MDVRLSQSVTIPIPDCIWKLAAPFGSCLENGRDRMALQRLRTFEVEMKASGDQISKVWELACGPSDIMIAMDCSVANQDCSYRLMNSSAVLRA